MIARAVAAERDGIPLTVGGSGRPYRQIMHVADLARALLLIVMKPDAELLAAEDPVIVCGRESQIREVGETVASCAGILDKELKFNTQFPDGPLKRTADVRGFQKLCPDFSFLELEDGVRRTMEWYRRRKQEGAVL